MIRRSKEVDSDEQKRCEFRKRGVVAGFLGFHQQIVIIGDGTGWQILMYVTWTLLGFGYDRIRSDLSIRSFCGCYLPDGFVENEMRRDPEVWLLLLLLDLGIKTL